MTVAMQTPEKQILPIAPAYPDLNNLTRWAGDLTRTLQQNLAGIARKANAQDFTGNVTVTGNLTVTGVFTYQGANIDNRFVNVTGDTMTGDLTISSSATHFLTVENTGGAAFSFQAKNPHTNLYFDSAGSFFINATSHSNVLTQTAGTDIVQVSSTAVNAFMPTTISVNGTTAPGGTAFQILWTEDSANGTDFRIYKDSASPAASDVVGRIIYQGKNSNNTATPYVVERAVIEDPTNGSEDSNWNVLTYVAGTLAQRVRVRNGMDLNGAADPGAGNIATNVVAFPATQVASSGANDLDDYEENTWTPAVDFGGATTGITYTTQVGEYTKIGRVVFVRGRITLSSKGTATGNARITGLPFTSSAKEHTVYSGFHANMSGLTGMITGYTNINSTNFQLTQFGAATIANITNTNFTNTSDFVFAAWYHV